MNLLFIFNAPVVAIGIVLIIGFLWAIINVVSQICFKHFKWMKQQWINPHLCIVTCDKCIEERKTDLHKLFKRVVDLSDRYNSKVTYEQSVFILRSQLQKLSLCNCDEVEWSEAFIIFLDCWRKRFPHVDISRLILSTNHKVTNDEIQLEKTIHEKLNN